MVAPSVFRLITRTITAELPLHELSAVGTSHSKRTAESSEDIQQQDDPTRRLLSSF